MISWKTRFVVLIMVVGLLAACTAPATEAPTLPATEKAATATQAPTNAPAATDTSAPAAASSPTTAPAAGTTVSFASDILPLLSSRCLNCHGGNRTEEGLSLRTYEDVMAGSEGGVVIVPGDAAHSHLFEMVSTQKMPKRGPKLTPDQVLLIETWINEGALNN